MRTSRLALNPGLADDEEDSETEFQQDDPLGMTILELVYSENNMEGIWALCVCLWVGGEGGLNRIMYQVRTIVQEPVSLATC